VFKTAAMSVPRELRKMKFEELMEKEDDEDARLSAYVNIKPLIF
jgi:hypothetical protein